MKYLKFRLADHRITRQLFRTPWIGKYSSYSEALAAIPPWLKFGFDQELMKQVYRSYPLSLVRSADYPVLLHLRDLLKPGSRVVDLGGNIGMACYLAQRYFHLPSPLEWVVCDVPAMLDTAREVEAREGTLRDVLRYITSLDDAGPCDVFFSSGTLQHLETTLPELLRKLPRLPPAILINRVPVWDRPPLTTIAIHYNRPVASPYQIFNRAQLIAGIEALGYRLADDWQCLECSMSIRFHPSLRLHAYHGFYLLRD